MIYENVSELAKRKKMSILQVEREAGIAKGSICKWKSVSPSVGNVQSVAKVLGVTVNRLLKFRKVYKYDKIKNTSDFSGE